MSYNTCSSPSELRITDMRFVDIDGAPKRCTLLKIMTNQGICGYGEVRDASSKTYALMLKSRILGENPCNIDLIFRRIKQFGFNGRQGGGVSAIEMACWDIMGKALNKPVWALLGGRFREKVDIELSDERSKYLRMKSWAWTGYIVVLVQAVGVIVALVLGNETVQLVLAYSVCLILAVYWVVYMILNKKY